MKRRNFIAGVGGSSIGASMLIGSGAFSRIESQRRVKIEVAEDPDALLGLDECPDSANASYTFIDEDTGHLNVDISPENPTDVPENDANPGTGINSNSFSNFDNVFQICNQGKEEFCVWIDAELNPDLTLDGDYQDENIVDFYLEDDPETSIVGPANAIFLDVGECICVGIATVTKGLKEGDQLLLDDEIVINADIDCPEPPNDDLIVDNRRAGISFVAFCIDRSETTFSPEEFTITPTQVKPGGDPVGISWESPVPVQSVVLKGGRDDFFTIDANGETNSDATEEVYEMGERGTGGRKEGQSETEPCGYDEALCSVKFGWNKFTSEFEYDPGMDDCFVDD